MDCIYLVRHELYVAWESALKAAGMCYHHELYIIPYKHGELCM